MQQLTSVKVEYEGKTPALCLLPPYFIQPLHHFYATLRRENFGIDKDNSRRYLGKKVTAVSLAHFFQSF
ncbi:hypothetical protein GTA51_10050 [Desulfovibrio aerotolerans]|uniref:Uncharacterized protein n=1 Tax=Solidesulfovibrio aerotolerans TaxID=295255 RepID=A0A7C9ISP5_9BACT|nr:hypothetical protein [Solidesulfovibrio aerotolerans]MYL83467.1 hypothetical protein [Solidesulfovibrio aerotolerans]